MTAMFRNNDYSHEAMACVNEGCGHDILEHTRRGKSERLKWHCRKRNCSCVAYRGRNDKP